MEVRFKFTGEILNNLDYLTELLGEMRGYKVRDEEAPLILLEAVQKGIKALICEAESTLGGSEAICVPLKRGTCFINQFEMTVYTDDC